MAKDLNGKKLPAGISQRPNGLYMARIMHNGETHTMYDRNLSNLKKRVIDLRYSLDHGTYIRKCNLTFEDWFNEWITTYKIPTVKQGTIDTYNKHYSANLKDSIGRMKLIDIRPEHLQRLLNGMKNEGQAENTIILVHCILSGVFKQAVKNELITRNPLDAVTRPHGVEKKEKVVFTREQQAVFMRYSEQSYLCGMFHLAMYTGMRGGELGGLLWSDIDFKNRVIHVRHNLVTTLEDGLKVDTPKTRTSVRDIPMIDQAYQLLKEQERAYRAYMGNTIKIGNDDFVFSVAGEPISRKRITHEIEVMLENMRADGIDFPHFTMHSTRHTFATRAIEEGMPPEVLKTVLGHSTLSMTMDLYVHTMSDTKTAAMDRIAAAL